MQKVPVYVGILFLVLVTILGCDSGKKQGEESGLPFEKIKRLQEITNTLSQPKAYTARVEFQGKDEKYAGELRVDREQNSVLKLERNPVFELALNQKQLATTGENSQTFDLTSGENLDWLRIGELFVLEPNILTHLKSAFIFKIASPLEDKLFVTAYPKEKNPKLELVVLEFSQNPLRLRKADVVLRTGTLACHADYSDYVNFSGTEIATKITVSWLVDWKPQNGVFVLTELK